MKYEQRESEVWSLDEEEGEHLAVVVRPLVNLGLGAEASRRAALCAQALNHGSIEAFVARVNNRAEAEMLKTGRLEGAHHRALEAELAELGGTNGKA